MGCNKLSRFLDWLAMRIALSELALIEPGGFDSWIDNDSRPGLDGVELASRWLFINEAQVVGKLLKSHQTAKVR